MLHSFALIFLILVIWKFNTFCVSVFAIFAMAITLIVILFRTLIFNVYIKLTCIIGVFINFIIHILIIFLCIFLKIFYFFMFDCFFCLFIILLLGVFANILHVSCLFFTNSNVYNLSSGSVF